jgi:hypothetical protein
MMMMEACKDPAFPALTLMLFCPRPCALRVLVTTPSDALCASRAPWRRSWLHSTTVICVCAASMIMTACITWRLRAMPPHLRMRVGMGSWSLMWFLLGHPARLTCAASLGLPLLL